MPVKSHSKKASNFGKPRESAGLHDQTLQQDFSKHSQEKMEHFQQLIESNQKQNHLLQQEKKSKQLKISSKNYIPVWNFFATE